MVALEEFDLKSFKADEDAMDKEVCPQAWIKPGQIVHKKEDPISSAASWVNLSLFEDEHQRSKNHGSQMHLLPYTTALPQLDDEITDNKRCYKRSSNSSKKLKGIQTLYPGEQEAADIMKALKESKKMSKRQPGTGGLNEGTGNILRVPDESTVISRASSEGTRSKPRVPDEEKLILYE
ncbi:hypothetical protein Tco_0831741 [Tanacetum coccineum]